MLLDLPADAAECYFVRFGQPEPPAWATWELASRSFLCTVSGEIVAVPAAIVLKWRLVNP